MRRLQNTLSDPSTVVGTSTAEASSGPTAARDRLASVCERNLASVVPATLEVLVQAAEAEAASMGHSVASSCNVYLARAAARDRAAFETECSQLQQDTQAVLTFAHRLFDDAQHADEHFDDNQLDSDWAAGVLDPLQTPSAPSVASVQAMLSTSNQTMVDLTCQTMDMQNADDALACDNRNMYQQLREASITITQLAGERRYRQVKSRRCAKETHTPTSSVHCAGPARPNLSSRAHTTSQVLDVLLANGHDPSNSVRLVFGARDRYVSVETTARLALRGPTRGSKPGKPTITDLHLWVPLAAFGLSLEITKQFVMPTLFQMSTVAAIDDYAEQLEDRLAPGAVVVRVLISELTDVKVLKGQIVPHLQNRAAVFYRHLRGCDLLHRQDDPTIRAQVELEFGALAKLLETWYTHVHTLGCYAFTTGQQKDIMCVGDYVRMTESTFKNIYVGGKRNGAGDGALLEKIVALQRCEYPSLIAAVVDVTDVVMLGMKVAYREVLFDSEDTRKRAAAALAVVDSAHAAAYQQSLHVPRDDARGKVYFDACGIVATRLSAAIAVWVQSTGNCGRRCWSQGLIVLKTCFVTHDASALQVYTVADERDSVRSITARMDAETKAAERAVLKDYKTQSSDRRQRQREQRDTRRAHHAAQSSGATKSCETFYDATTGALVAHLLQTYYNLQEDPIDVVDMIRNTLEVIWDEKSGTPVARWRTLDDDTKEKLMQVVDDRELQVVAAGQAAIGLQHFDAAERAKLFNASTVVRTSRSSCFTQYEGRSADDAHLMRTELPRALAELRRMHCGAMSGMTADTFSSKTSRDPADGAVVAVTSDLGYKATWQDQDRDLGGNVAFYSFGVKTSERNPTSAVFAQYPSAVQLLAASGKRGGLTLVGHVKPTLMAKVAPPCGLLYSVTQTHAWRVVGRAAEIVAETHHPGLVDVGRRVLYDTDTNGRAMDSCSLIEYPCTNRWVIAKEQHMDDNNVADGPQVGFAQMYGHPGPYEFSRTALYTSDNWKDINEYRVADAENDVSSEETGQEGLVSIASVDYHRRLHRVHSVVASTKSDGRTMWNCSTGIAPREGCTVVVCQRKGKVVGSQYVKNATIPISQWLQLTFPNTAIQLGNEFFTLLETVKAATLLPAQYKAARRDGLLPSTQPYSQRDWKPRDYREARRRAAMDLDGDADDEDTGEVDIYNPDSTSAPEPSPLDQTAVDNNSSATSSPNFSASVLRTTHGNDDRIDATLRVRHATPQTQTWFFKCVIVAAILRTSDVTLLLCVLTTAEICIDP